MILKTTLIALATEENLQPTTVEKDYALGWMLYAVSRHPEASAWIFKGGTCLKKCFFNTYRFSEDLDFTIPKDRLYDHSGILGVLSELTRWVEEESGIRFPSDGLTLEEYENPRGNPAFQARASFVGPLQMGRRSLQRVKFDLTQDEVIADSPSSRRVNHPYEDETAPAPEVLCYSVEEILAEKSRALYERQGRARDVYDVVHLSRAFRESVNQVSAHEIAKVKFEFKGLPGPTVDAIMNRIDTGILRANWEHQLVHQLPNLPDVQGFIDDLRGALAWWLDPAYVSHEPPPIPASPGQQLAPRESFPYRRPVQGPRALSRFTGPSLGRITYAGRNRLCLQIRYHGVRRLVEPYSIRYPSTGNRLLYAWELQRGSRPSGRIKAFKLDEMESVQVTNQSFVPRHAVEL